MRSLRGHKITPGAFSNADSCLPTPERAHHTLGQVALCASEGSSRSRKKQKLTMCPSEAAGKEWAGLNGGLMMVCSALDNTGRDAEDFHFWQQVTLMNQIHLVPIPLASALPIVVILRGASTQSALMYQAVDGKEQSLQDSSQRRRTPQGRM